MTERAREQSKPSIRVELYALTALVCVSAAVRSALAWRHTTPRYFPDEYIYATLGRSLAHGHYAIRGVGVTFPALLEPLLAAPLWRFFSPHSAYQLIQVENAAAASLAAVPAYLLARWLGLERRAAFLCALFTIAIPMLALIPLTIADPIAYPLALSATYAGILAIETPTRRRQFAFFAFAVLATLARTQYVVLVAAYVVAAASIAGRDVYRRHRVALLALAPVAVIGVVAVSTFYSGVLHTTHLNGSFLRWFFLQPFLLALEAGVVMVPGAVAGLIRPATQRQRAFAFFVATLWVLLLVEASVYASSGGRFKERYLAEVLPLIPIAFFVYLARGRPYPRIVVSIALVIAVAAARLPISSYATGLFRTDSQFLYAIGWAEGRFGAGTTAFYIALATTAAAGLAVLIAYKGDRAAAVTAGIVVALASTVGAIHVDLDQTRTLRAALPHDLSWVDHQTTGPVTALLTPGSSQGDLFIASYWNPSIVRQLRVAGASPLDPFSTPKLRVAPNGRLLNAGRDLLFDSSGTTGSFSNARRTATAQSLALWHSAGPPRFRLLIEHRSPSGWLGPYGQIRAWPRADENRRGVGVSFVLSLPRDFKRRVRLHIGKDVFVVPAGGSRRVRCVNPTGPVDRTFFTPDVTLTPSLEQLSVRMTNIRVVDGVSGTGCTSS
jgi:hypothetical protein